MALTDTRPETSPVAATAPVEGGQVSNPLNLVGTGDHKALGLVWISLSLLFGIVGWIVTALAGVHGVGDGGFLSDDAANTLFTGGRIGLVLLVAIPLFIGLATYIVPLQVGANTVAFPRAAAASVWTWILSGAVFIVCNGLDGGVGGGRTKAVDVCLLAIAGMVVALLFATVSVVTTAVALRTPGMSLDRTPFFTWAAFVGGSVWLLTLPVLLANIALIYVDHRYGQPSEFGVEAGQWAQLSWITTQPQVYALAIPGLGIVADVVATLSGVRQANRGIVYALIGAFGVLSVGAWAQPYFFPDVAGEIVFAAMALFIVFPTVLLLGGWATTLRTGRLALKSPLALSLVSGLLLVLATVLGFVYVITPLELRETGYYSAGVFALVVAAALSAALAGVMYWAPKMSGREPSDGIGMLNALVMLGGGALAGIPLVVLGFATKFDGLGDAADLLQVLAVIGDAMLALGAFLGIAALLTTARGPRVEADPWGTGQSLEWACPSPPPPGNFGELAVVRSPEPLLDAAEPVEEA